MAPKCQHTDCKLKVQLDVPCKCCKKFCPKHRMPEDHACSFDFKETGKVTLSSTLVKVVAEKVIMI